MSLPREEPLNWFSVLSDFFHFDVYVTTVLGEEEALNGAQGRHGRGRRKEKGGNDVTIFQLSLKENFYPRCSLIHFYPFSVIMCSYHSMHKTINYVMKVTKGT